jgi:gamma-glutamylputrescine oxidase
MLSIWEQQSFIQYHYIIIGSGIVGINTAILLKKKYPACSVLILERGILPSGASTKNAGFACVGSATELLDNLQSDTKENVLQLFEKRIQGLNYTRQLLGDANIGYEANGSYELLQQDALPALEKIEWLNDILKNENSQHAFTIENSIIATAQFNNNIIKSAIRNNCEGSIDTGKMMQALLQKARQLDVQIITGCEVTKYEYSEKNIAIICKNNSNQETIIFKAQHLLLCTNAFTKTLVPDIAIQPGRGMVMATAPIDNLKFEGIYHLDAGYFYFRNVGNRVIFGGGRNLDFETETTTDFGVNEKIKADLITKLNTIILPTTPYTLDYCWSGIMAFGPTKNPIITKVSHNVYAAVRCGGMGVAIGSAMAQELVQLIET